MTSFKYPPFHYILAILIFCIIMTVIGCYHLQVMKKYSLMESSKFVSAPAKGKW